MVGRQAEPEDLLGGRVGPQPVPQPPDLGQVDRLLGDDQAVEFDQGDPRGQDVEGGPEDRVGRHPGRQRLQVGGERPGPDVVGPVLLGPAQCAEPVVGRPPLGRQRPPVGGLRADRLRGHEVQVLAEGRPADQVDVVFAGRLRDGGWVHGAGTPCRVGWGATDARPVPGGRSRPDTLVRVDQLSLPPRPPDESLPAAAVVVVVVVIATAAEPAGR